MPHFHAVYAGEQASIAIETLDVLAGSVPERALRLIRGPLSTVTSCDRTGSGPATTSRSKRSPRFPSIRCVSDLARVTDVEVAGDHRLRLRFDDGVSGEVDASGWDWRGVFEALADPKFFARAHVDEQLGTVVWPNGADVAPETLRTLVLEERRGASV